MGKSSLRSIGIRTICPPLATIFAATSLSMMNVAGQNIETLYMPGGPNDMTLQEMKSANIQMIIHVPYEKDFLNAASEAGVKVLPYVDLEKAVKSSGDPTLLRNPFWRAVDADTSKHPEWLCVTTEGKIKRPFNDMGYHPGFEQSCNNHGSLFAAQMKGIEDIMKQGCGGVFIDNADPTYECYGEKLGFHKHDEPEKTNRECFGGSIYEVYKKVKGFGEDKRCVINSGFIANQKGRCDCSIAESIMYGFQRPPGHDSEMNRKYWRSAILYWQNLKNDKANFAVLQRNDVPRMSFSYMMDPCSDDEAAFFSFAYTKLLGMKMWGVEPCQWNGDYPNFLARRDMARLLYRIHDLGAVDSKMFYDKDYAYQSFKRGIVVANASGRELKLKIPCGSHKAPLAELFSGEALTIEDGAITLPVPSEGGRVVMDKKEVLENYLAEANAEAKAVRDYVASELKVGNKEFSNPGIPSLFDALANRIQVQLDKVGKEGNPDARELDKLSLEASGISLDGIMRESAETIMANAGTLDADGIVSLLQLQNDEPKVEIFRGGSSQDVIKPVIMTAKSAFLPFHYLPNTFLNLGEDKYFNMFSGPVARFGASGEDFLDWRTKKVATLLVGKLPAMEVSDSYVAPVAFEKFERLPDDGDIQRYDVLCRLAGQSSRTEVKSHKLKMAISVRKGSPFLHLDFALVDNNFKEAGNAELQLSFGGMKGYINSKSGSELSTGSQKADWAYFVTNKADRIGVVALGSPSLNLFKNGFKDNGHLKCAITALCAREQFFLEERLRNLKLYTSKASALLHGIHLKLKTAGDFSITGKNHVALEIDNKSLERVKSVDWKLDGRASGMSRDQVVTLDLKSENAKDGNSISYDFEMPKNFSENDFAYFLAEADVTLEDGSRFPLVDFKSGRVKAPLQIGDFAVFEQSGRSVKSCIGLSAMRPCKGNVSLTLDNPSVKVKAPSESFNIKAGKEAQVVFEVDASSEMMNQKIDGLLKIQPEGLPSKELSVSLKFSPSISIPYRKDAPRIDGKLDDPLWNDAGFNVKDFLFTTSGMKVKDQTEVSVFHTDKALYVGFKCYTKNMDSIVETAVPDENGYSMAALKNDCVEIYLRPQPKEKGNFYIRLGGNSKGVRRNDQFVDVTLINAGIYNDAGKHTWKMATSKYADRWEAEIEIPFDVIGCKPSKGETWGINFCRIQPQGDGSSSWSYTCGPFATPNFFGWGTFE